MKTRKQKIEFLNGLLTGKRTVTELQSPQFFFFVWDRDTQLYYSNDEKTILTEEQFKNFKNRNIQSEFFIVKTTTEMRLAIKGL